MTTFKPHYSAGKYRSGWAVFFHLRERVSNVASPQYRTKREAVARMDYLNRAWELERLTRACARGEGQ